MSAENEPQSSETSIMRIDRAKLLLQDGHISQAEALCETAVHDDPENEEGLYVHAVSQRYLGRYEDALKTLNNLQALRPNYGRAWQEEGYVQLALKRNDAAIAAFKRAVKLNNALVGSWQSLIELTSRGRDEPLNMQAQDQFARLSALAPELLSTRSLMAEGKLFKAEQLCRLFMQKNPRNVEGMRLLADLGVRSDVLDDAEFILESAVEFEPDNNLARFDYMNVLYKRQKYEQAMHQAELLKEREPDNLNFATAYANQCVAVGRFEDALIIYDDAIGKTEQNALLYLLRGHALKTIARLDDAIESYRNAYRARPDFGDAYWSLANLKTYRFTDDEVEAMQAVEKNEETLPEDRIHLCFALGKSFEDQEDYKDSFKYYERGNDLKKKQLRYDAERMSQTLDLQEQLCTAELFTRNKGNGHEAADPIFIVGLPRAGSTLLEQILASHSQVDGTMELPNISALAHRIDGRRKVSEDARYPAKLHELTPEQLKRFGEAFIEDTRIHRAGAPFFIDKMPNNFRHIGLIQLILPNAKIIDARRHPMACCYSGFKQLFAHGQEFTYGLYEIGRYYHDYVALMDHWDNVLPGKILRVQYEDVVADLETQVRKILNHCGLEFEQGCLDFHKTERSVRTPSSEQVRQPIFKAGLEQWRNYEPWLEPLTEALGPVLERYPISDSGVPVDDIPGGETDDG